MASATAYGVTVAIGRSLAEGGVGSTTALGTRFALGALILCAVQGARRGPLLPAPGERAAVFLLGALGYALESSFFFAALERGSAAAVALLFYAYPGMVTVAELVAGRVRSSPRLLAALVCSAAGVAVVVGTGGEVEISGAGVAFALLSAVAFTAYLLGSARVVARTDPVVNAAWVSGGAAVSLLTRGAVEGSLHWPSGRAGQLLGYGLANAVAFGLMFTALSRIGATRTAVVLTFEVFAAVVLGAVFLDEPLELVQVVGGVFIVAGAILVSLAVPRQVAVEELEAPPP